MIYRFGRFTINGDTRQLLADGGEVHLSPKALALLTWLVEHRSRALSKAELQERLWPSTFVGETNLATLVAEIRRALGDSAHHPEYVRTVHRFGYRFVGSVAEVDRAAADVRPASRMYLRTGDRQFLLVEGTTVIGRGDDATVRIESGGVSRHHARVIISGDRAHIEDLGSKNGTFVRGQRITSACLLQDGDEIRVGPVEATFRVTSATEVTETLQS